MGGYDILRYEIERVGDNLTAACNADGTLCAIAPGHGLIGSVLGAVDGCPRDTASKVPPVSDSS